MLLKRKGVDFPAKKIKEGDTGERDIEITGSAVNQQ
jgi:hypothetical protein